MVLSINEYRKIYEDAQDRINVSCVAIAQIEIDGKFLLMKEAKFQPIGGGLKYEDSALPFLYSIDFTTTRTDNDLRISIPKSNWDKFKQWFENGIDREVTIDREIEEEVSEYLDTSILKKLNTVHYYNKVVILNEKYYIFQIHHVTFNNEVKNALLQLVNDNPLFKLFTRNQIFTQRNIIAGHSLYITNTGYVGS